MRIFRKECKKILDVRILLILTVFTIFYYQLFMQITEYPCGGQCTDSLYDIPFCAVLLIPYQVRERLRFVQPLYASTAVGRKIFLMQFWSAIGACVLVGLVQFGVYLFIFIEKGLAVFWKCPCWDSVVNLLWCDGISFGTYMFLYMVLVFIFTLAAVVVFYLAARVATNYISGIAIAIPLCGGSGVLSYLLFHSLFLIRNTDRMPFTELPWIGGWLIIAGVILWWRFWRDRRRDI